MTYRITAFPMTFRDPQSHLHIANLFKCDFSYSCAAVNKISTEIARRAVPLQSLSFLYCIARTLSLSLSQSLLICFL